MAALLKQNLKWGDNHWLERFRMGNSFGKDILIQAEDPTKAAQFYVRCLGFEITEDKPNMISLHGNHINLFVERGPPLGPVLEVTVDDVAEASERLVRNGGKVLKDEPNVPRVYIQDPYGLIYNLTQ
jgi:predicted enzyme related to lactoylglutathione lyase